MYPISVDCVNRIGVVFEELMHDQFLFVYREDSRVKIDCGRNELMNLLRAMANGYTLKSHRYLDGTKVYQLHALDGQIEEVPQAIVAALQDQQLIDSNKKFPAATYWLTETGRTKLNEQPSTHS